MTGDLRCVEGRLWRHDVLPDDPYFESDVGKCPDCGGAGCSEDGEDPGSKNGKNARRYDRAD